MRVLLYHSVLPDTVTHSVLCRGHVHLSEFRRQMEWLKSTATIVALDQAVASFKGKTKLPRNATAITFDDGMANTFDYAWPVLKEMQIPATIFVATAHLNGVGALWFNVAVARAYLSGEATGSSPYGGLSTATDDFSPGALPLGLPEEINRINFHGMSESQLKTLAASGLVTIGGHGHSHLRLNLLDDPKTKEDLELNIAELNRITGQKPKYFAYPEGFWNDNVVDVVKSLGYDAAFTVEKVKSSEKSDFLLPRTGIYSDDFNHFRLKWYGLGGLSKVRQTIYRIAGKS